MRAPLVLVGLALLAPVAAGCTIRHECIPTVTPTTTSALGIANLELCGIGHCVSIGRYGQPTLRFRLPDAPGATTLEELEAQRCVDASARGYNEPYVDPCEPVTGTIVVREVHPPEEGVPVGRLDADVRLTGATSSSRIDYREAFVDRCSDVDWPDIRIPWPGPGQL